MFTSNRNKRGTNRIAAASGRERRGVMLSWAAWFLLANSVVLMLISLYYVKDMTITGTALSTLFFVVAYPGHFISLAFYLFPLIALAIVVYPSRRFVFSLAILAEGVLIFIVIIDCLVFAQYRFHLNGMVWNLLTSGAVQDILPLTTVVWLSGAAAIIVLLLVELVVAQLAWRWCSGQRSRYGFTIGCCAASVILAGHLLHAWADANHYTSITKQVRYLPAYKPLTMKRLMVRLGFASEQKKSDLSLKNDVSALRYPLEQISCQDSGEKLNVLLIVIDSWRADAITAEITPNIWKLAQESWRFDRHYSSGNATRFGIFGLFYGLYGTYWHSMLAEEKSPVLMRELEKRKYRMEILASAPLISPEFDRTVFADMRSRIELRQTGEGSVANDRIISEKMIRFLASGAKDKPFFGFMFLDAPHVAEHPENITRFQPTVTSVNHITLNNNTDPVPYLNRYKNSVYYNDQLVGQVLAQLDKSGLRDNTVVIVTGDHGEEFNDLRMNYWGHAGNFSRFQTQTPLVIRWPGKQPELFTHTTSHLDIAPTLMKELLACSTPPASFSNGRNVRDTSPRPYILISSWDTFSTNEPDRISVVHKSGEIDILDNNYNTIAGAKLRPEISRSAMEGMGRFYAR